MRTLTILLCLCCLSHCAADDFFLLQKIDKTPPQSQLNHPNVDGFSIRVRWRTLEPQDGVFSWTYLDRQVNNARQRNKPYMLRIMAGTNAPGHSYVATQNGIPTPWHPVHQREFERLISAVANRYANDPYLVLVHVPGFWKSAEMHLPRGNWPNPEMTAAWLHRVNVLTAAFPQQQICINHSPKPFSRDVVLQASAVAGPRFVVQMNALKASTNPMWIGYTGIVTWGQAGGNTGWQFVGPSTNENRFGGPFMQAVRLGRVSSPLYFETYAPDLGRVPDD